MRTTLEGSLSLFVFLIRISFYMPTCFAGFVSEKVCQHNLESVSTAGGLPQSGKSPYSISANQSKYIPGQATKVTIGATAPFIGFVLQARHFSTPDVVGTFGKLPPGVTLHSCSDPNNTISAWYSTIQRPQNLTFTWISPDTDQGTVHFLATVYKDNKTYWTNLQSRRFRKGFATIQLGGCGKEKSCFRYAPRGKQTCDQETCEYLVTYRVTGPEAHFEMSAKADWAAIGFSSDDKMGGDDVFMCMRTRTVGAVRHYQNEYAYQTPHLQDSNPLYNHQVEVTEDGRIACRFSRQLKVANGHQNIDLNNDWYQLYAWGPLSQSGTLMRHYEESPPVSEKTTMLRKRNVISGSSQLETSVSRQVACFLLLWMMTKLLLSTS